MSNIDIFNWQPSEEEVKQFAEQLAQTEGGRQLIELVETGTISVPEPTPAPAAPAAAAPAPAAPAGATTYDPTQQRVVPVEQARVVTTVTPTRTTETQTPATALAAANRARLADVETAAKAAIQRGGSANQTRVDELVAGVKSGIYSAADALGALGSITAVASGVGDGETPEERIARLDREARAEQARLDREAAERADAAARAATEAATGQRRENAFNLIGSFLQKAGLQGLDKNIRDLLAQGIEDPDAILFSLRDTPQFRARFKANAARARKGLPELDPATYIGLEQSYASTLRANRLPPGFYDQPDDFNALIEGDVSAQELQARISEGFVKVRDADPEVRRQMQTLYGVGSDEELAAYFLDPEKGLQALERQARAAEIAARGREQGRLQLTTAQAEELARRGITSAEAQRDFMQRGMLEGLYQPLYGEEALTGEQEIGAIFGYDPEAQKRLQQRRTQRLAEFQAGGQFARTTGATSGTVETGLGTAQ